MGSFGPTLDIVIGLFFVFLLVSLMTTAVQEVIATWVNKRGAILKDSVANLLDGAAKPKDPLSPQIFDHPLVTGLSTSPKPAYLPARQFSLALVDVLKDGSKAALISQIGNTLAALPNANPAKKALVALLDRSKGDLDAFSGMVESWFDDAMDRASGVYKLWARQATVYIGLAIAVIGNVDAIRIMTALHSDSNMRAALAATAEAYVAKNPTLTADNTAADKNQTQSTNNTFADIQGKLESLPVPIGWSGEIRDSNSLAYHVLCSFSKNINDMNLCKCKQGEGFWNYAGQFFWKSLGFLIIAISASFGAPFWFDLLKQVINIRGAGPKPARSDASATQSS